MFLDKPALDRDGSNMRHLNAPCLFTAPGLGDKPHAAALAADMRAADTELKTAKNRRDESVAFPIYTDTADAVDHILGDHMFHRGWRGFALPSGHTVSNGNSGPRASSLATHN